jgi:hypothetical protein
VRLAHLCQGVGGRSGAERCLAHCRGNGAETEVACGLRRRTKERTWYGMSLLVACDKDMLCCSWTVGARSEMVVWRRLDHRSGSDKSFESELLRRITAERFKTTTY